MPLAYNVIQKLLLLCCLLAMLDRPCMLTINVDIKITHCNSRPVSLSTVWVVTVSTLASYMWQWVFTKLSQKKTKNKQTKKQQLQTNCKTETGSLEVRLIMINIYVQCVYLID